MIIPHFKYFDEERIWRWGIFLFKGLFSSRQALISGIAMIINALYWNASLKLRFRIS